MTEHHIDLSMLKAYGQTLTEMQDNILYMSVTRANPLDHCKPGVRCLHYAEIPGRYRLPLRINITVKIDVPSFYIMLGEGHVNFGDYFGNRRLDDICEQQNKTNYFDGRVPVNEFVNISLIYDLKEMQVLVNGEERYYSKREKYMKSSLLSEMNSVGFPLRISCSKRTKTEIRSICVIEYNESAEISHNTDPHIYKFVPPTGKPGLEEALQGLPGALREAIVDIDEFLKELRPMKFKRQINTGGDQIKISYVASEQGFSYVIHIADDVMYHTLQWYIITQGKPETWGRKKADRMEDTLKALELTDPAFAQRMFHNLHECVGGYGPGCLAKTPYIFDGERVIACHGKIYFNMNLTEFDDVKRFISKANEIA